MIRFSVISLFFLFTANYLSAQTFQSGDSTISVMRAIIVGKDTILVSDIPEVEIYPRRKFKNRYQYYRYRRLIRNVKKAHPYAKLAAEKFSGIDERLSNMASDRQRRAYIKTAEKELRDEFEDELVHLTVSQGRLLMKLIDRELGKTTFFVLQDIKGNFKAVFWQGIARIFGSNLKTGYDPEGEDAMIEEIILLIEAGQL